MDSNKHKASETVNKIITCQGAKQSPEKSNEIRHVSIGHLYNKFCNNVATRDNLEKVYICQMCSKIKCPESASLCPNVSYLQDFEDSKNILAKSKTSFWSVAMQTKLAVNENT